MAGDEDRDSFPGLPAEQVAQLHPAVRVESGRRLVEQQHRRLMDERPGQPEPLFLAAGEHVHRPVGELLQPRQPQQLRRPLTPPLPPQPVGRADELQVLPRGEVVVDAEHVRRPPHPGAHRLRLPDRVVPGHPHVTGVGHQQRGQDEQQRGLPGAVRADEGGHLARSGGEVDAADILYGAETTAYADGRDAR